MIHLEVTYQIHDYTLMNCKYTLDAKPRGVAIELTLLPQVSTEDLDQTDLECRDLAVPVNMSTNATMKATRYMGPT